MRCGDFIVTVPVPKGFEFRVSTNELSLYKNLRYLEKKPLEGTVTFKIKMIADGSDVADDPGDHGWDEL